MEFYKIRDISDLLNNFPAVFPANTRFILVQDTRKKHLKEINSLRINFGIGSEWLESPDTKITNKKLIWELLKASCQNSTIIYTGNSLSYFPRSIKLRKAR